MPKNYAKKKKHANIMKAHHESSDKSAIAIAKKPTAGHLLKFTLPTILSMVIMNTFGIVDGIFVSRIIDPIALSAVAIVFPFLTFVLAIGFMLGVGGNALVAKKIGAGQIVEGRENFSLIALTAFISAVVISIIGIAAPNFVLNILGVDEFLRPMSMEYIQPILYFLPVVLMGMVFQQFLITEGKAHISAITSVLGGLTSAGLNFLLIYVMDMGLQGAALATAIGYSIPSLVGFAFFAFRRKGNLYFVKPKLDFRALGRSCINGASEMVTMLAISITTVLLNNILMGMDGGGPEAVAAAAIIFAGFGLFAAIFMGYSSGVAPIISYNFGKEDTDNLKLVFKNSIRIILTLSTAAIGLAWLLTTPLIAVYDVPAGTAIHDMATTGFRTIALGFVFAGFNVFGSMFFTALNNGVVSSLLSFFQTLVFVTIAYLTLPAIFGINGAWAAMPVAETLGVALTIFFFKKMRKRYNYA